MNSKAIKMQKYNETESIYNRSLVEPSRIEKQADSIENAVNSIKIEISSLHKNIEEIADDTKIAIDKKSQIECLRKTLDEKIEKYIETIDNKEREEFSLVSNLEKEKLRNNDLVTVKIELNLRKKESENFLRRSLDEQNNFKKKYDILKRQLKKKRIIADETKQSIPSLESKLLDSNISLKIYRDEQIKIKSDLKLIRIDTDGYLVQLLQIEGLENSMKQVSNNNL